MIDVFFDGVLGYVSGAAAVSPPKAELASERPSRTAMRMRTISLRPKSDSVQNGGRSRRSRPLALVMLVATLASAVACKDEGTIQVGRISFNGVKGISESQLRNALATRQSAKLPLGKKQYFDRTRFDADLRRVQAFYSDKGYPDARVTGFDVRLNSDQDKVDITLTIDEGRPLRISSIDYYGFEAVPHDRVAEMQRALPIRVGEVRERPKMVEAQGYIQDRLRDSGFAYARAWVTEKIPQPGEVDVAVTADPGRVVHFGEVEVAGNSSVGDDVIRRDMLYQPGDLFSRSAMLNTQRRLYGMELFQFANVQVLDADEQYPEVKTRVTVAESKHQRVNFGVGYGTEEKGRIDGEYRHVNVLGGARSGGLHARWSSLDRGIRVNVTQPYFLLKGYSLATEGQQWYTFTPAYQSVVSGAKASIIHRTHSQRHSWTLSFTSEHDSSAISNDVLTDLTLRNALIALGLDPRTGKQDGTLNSVSGDAQFNGTDNLLDAPRGYQLAMHVEQAGRLVPGSFQYFGTAFDARHYIPIRTIVIANRLQLSSVAPEDGEASIPFSKRLFLGGATSVRGWGRFEISPLSGSGLPIGGESLFAWSTEARLPLTEKLGGVLFVDAGNVWSDAWSIDVTRLRYAVGPGLRYRTPIGPLRFDVGYQLNPIPDLIVNGEPQRRRWRLHFSVGQAF